MSFRHTEHFDSRDTSGSVDQSTDMTWVYTTFSEHVPKNDVVTDHVAYLDGVVPSTVVDPFKPTRTLHRDNGRINRLAEGIYRFEITYRDGTKHDEKSQLDTGEYKFSVSTRGGTQKLLASREVVAVYKKNGVAEPEDKQMLGITESGEAQGVDVIVPACKYQISYRQPLATITEAYVRTVEELTGTVNDDTFFGRPAGEVLFLGANGSQGTKADPTWDYEFVRLPNVTNQVVDGITIAAKKGHEYLDFRIESSGGAERMVRRPYAVVRHRLYDEADFSLLGIGT